MHTKLMMCACLPLCVQRQENYLGVLSSSYDAVRSLLERSAETLCCIVWLLERTTI